MTIIADHFDCRHEWVGQDYHCLEQQISLIEIQTEYQISVNIPSGNLSLISYECKLCSQKKIQIKLRKPINLNTAELSCAENY